MWQLPVPRTWRRAKRVVAQKSTLHMPHPSTVLYGEATPSRQRSRYSLQVGEQVLTSRRLVRKLTWVALPTRHTNIVMGAGSLVLASAMAALGWVAGIICMLLFAAITFGCGQLLIMCHEHDGKRHHTYYSAVRHILGARHAKVLFVAQQIKTVMMGACYVTCTGSLSPYAPTQRCHTPSRLARVWPALPHCSWKTHHIRFGPTLVSTCSSLAL